MDALHDELTNDDLQEDVIYFDIEASSCAEILERINKLSVDSAGCGANKSVPLMKSAADERNVENDPPATMDALHDELKNYDLQGDVIDFELGAISCSGVLEKKNNKISDDSAGRGATKSVPPMKSAADERNVENDPPATMDALLTNDDLQDVIDYELGVVPWNEVVERINKISVDTASRGSTKTVPPKKSTADQRKEEKDPPATMNALHDELRNDDPHVDVIEWEAEAITPAEFLEQISKFN